MGGSRWSPTAEQLLALEEKYRCGTRTPTTDQIQQIASELRGFGKIEGKNVFYWFQNHKARERQKRRLCQGPLSVHGAEIAESGTNGWSEFEEKELQQMKSSSLDMHAMWHTIDLSSSPPVHHFKSTMTTTTSKFSSLEEHSSLLRPSKRESRANHHDDEIREVQALQLFPHCSDNCNGSNGTEKDKQYPSGP
ncbi:hypothetical protein D5086_016570 [Populus alba]|uniref:Uncharacterized protein n=1 Tax=Populus alba TaxID=43335 RepID=A0ACC4BUB0_POPAL